MNITLTATLTNRDMGAVERSKAGAEVQVSFHRVYIWMPIPHVIGHGWHLLCSPISSAMAERFLLVFLGDSPGLIPLGSALALQYRCNILYVISVICHATSHRAVFYI